MCVAYDFVAFCCEFVASYVSSIALSQNGEVKSRLGTFLFTIRLHGTGILSRNDKNIVSGLHPTILPFAR